MRSSPPEIWVTLSSRRSTSPLAMSSLIIDAPASTKIVGLIKDAGVTLLASIAGLLLAAIAVQMLANAIKTFAAN